MSWAEITAYNRILSIPTSAKYPSSLPHVCHWRKEWTVRNATPIKLVLLAPSFGFSLVWKHFQNRSKSYLLKPEKQRTSLSNFSWEGSIQESHEASLLKIFVYTSFSQTSHFLHAVLPLCPPLVCLAPPYFSSSLNWKNLPYYKLLSSSSFYPPISMINTPLLPFFSLSYMR